MMGLDTINNKREYIKKVQEKLEFKKHDKSYVIKEIEKEQSC